MAKGNIQPLVVPTNMLKVTSIDPNTFLSKIWPFGATRMRDATGKSIEKLWEISQYLDRAGVFQRTNTRPYSLKIIVLTDGEDTHSILTPTDFSRMISVNQNIRFNFITIDIPEHSQQLIELKGVENINRNVRVTPSDTNNLKEIFERLIIEEYQVRTTHQANNGVINEREELITTQIDQNYIIVFALDISDSMNQYNRWGTLKSSLAHFLRHLQNSESYFGVILFNHHILSWDDLFFEKRFVVGMYDCFKSPGALMWNICCPLIAVPCMQAKALSISQKKQFVMKSFCISLLCAYPIGCALNRSQIRRDYEIPGSCCTDCILFAACCGPCLGAQSYLEAKKRGVSLNSFSI